MTRLNIAISTIELCDQHLVAEYRELPRMVAFSHRTKDIPDQDFTLNTGHMRSCVRYGAYLADRHALLIEEMKVRGFNANLPPIYATSFPPDARRWPSQAWLALAVPIVRQRIAERIKTMRRQPTWTNRIRPAWTTL